MEPTTPPATPPLSPPPQAPAPTPDLLAPPQYVPINPENEPDHLLRTMVSKRRKPAPKPEPEGATATPAEPATPPVAEEKPADPKPVDASFNDSIGKVFGWKPGQKKKAEPKVEEPAAAAPAAPAAPATVDEPAAPKTIVGKRKSAAPAPAPDITEITTAATTAAVRALQSSPSKPADVARKPEDALSPEDRHDYEVALALAQSNPKYKDAPNVVLDHVKKSEAYAARWETANPGKQFDPEDDDHNEFFDSLEKPWSDHEFRTAETEMVAERIAAKSSRHADTKIRALEQDNARLELAPIVKSTFASAAGYMAVELKVLDKMSGGWDKFMEEDPIAAEAIASVLGPIEPLIEAIVQIDDPRGRFPLDENNTVHQQWIQLLMDKELQYAGVENNGKVFATRVAFSRMPPAQRARHWHLTADHLATELVQDAVSAASERVKTEKERQQKIARSLGYVLPDDPKADPAKTVATNGAAAHTPAPAPANVEKPVSPSVGSGAKIDSKGGTTPTGRGATLAAMGGILFPPRNPVT